VKFNETFTLVQNGKKTATTRKLSTYAYYRGKVGKTVPAEGPDGQKLRIKILAVRKVLLWVVAGLRHDEEGFDEPWGFIETWHRIYGDFDPLERAVFIRFQKVKP
jgi:hypothetical protein